MVEKATVIFWFNSRPSAFLGKNLRSPIDANELFTVIHMYWWVDYHRGKIDQLLRMLMQQSTHHRVSWTLLQRTEFYTDSIVIIAINGVGVCRLNIIRARSCQPVQACRKTLRACYINVKIAASKEQDWAEITWLLSPWQQSEQLISFHASSVHHYKCLGNYVDTRPGHTSVLRHNKHLFKRR